MILVCKMGKQLCNKKHINMIFCDYQMGLFHDTLKDAEKLFTIDKQSAIKILRKHQKDARNLNAGIGAWLTDYYDGLGGICGALEKNDIAEANMWIEGQRKSLRNLKRQLWKLRRALE